MLDPQLEIGRAFRRLEIGWILRNFTFTFTKRMLWFHEIFFNWEWISRFSTLCVPPIILLFMWISSFSKEGQLWVPLWTGIFIGQQTDAVKIRSYFSFLHRNLGYILFSSHEKKSIFFLFFFQSLVRQSTKINFYLKKHDKMCQKLQSHFKKKKSQFHFFSQT